MKTIMLLLVGTALTCFVYGYGCILSPTEKHTCTLTTEYEWRRNWFTVSGTGTGKSKKEACDKACAQLRRLHDVTCPWY